MMEIKEQMIQFIVEYYRKNLFYPSYSEIAEGTGRTKSTIHVHMRKLEGEGVIIRKADYSPQYRLINMEFLLKNGVSELQKQPCGCQKEVGEKESM